MVAAEAAACGCPPLVADHSGMATVAAGIAAEYPAEHRTLASFASGDVDDLARKLARCSRSLRPNGRRSRRRRDARPSTLWSWENVAALLLSRGGRGPAT